MTASKTYPVPENILQSTHLTASQYDEMYKQSVEQPEAFWAEHASMLEWYQKP
ncbi:MAG: acetyl-coenzyme A synthetase N-terminal domain-containing protein, partial [Pseudomonadota bacterium]|nr:acetyl-coenzyme A synthetase N-terminal domain-containing protein [Pseudomonadota bacterium]